MEGKGEGNVCVCVCARRTERATSTACPLSCFTNTNDDDHDKPGQSIYTRLAGGFLTVLGLTGALIVQKWEEKFIFQDWDHSKNH